MSSYEPMRIPVDGGDLAGGRWGSGGRLIVASHGITANHLSWQAVGERLLASDADVSLVAIDHRGRAGSADVPGTHGMQAHGDDLIAVLDHFGAGSAILTGHSMGGFVAASAAEHHPDRVERLVLVDGGVPFPMNHSPDDDIEAVVQSVIGPALERLDQRWPDEEAYVDFFRAHPAFQPPNEWPAALEAYVRLDCVTMPDGTVGSSASKDAVLVDGAAAIVDPESASSVQRISHPTAFLWAPRGVLDDEPGLFPPDYVKTALAGRDHVESTRVEGTNHYTILVGAAGAAAVAEALLAR